MAEKTNLREANATIKVEGVLSEKNLEEKITDNKGVIKGNLTIKTSKDNYITFNVYMNEYKSDRNGGFSNDKNKMYAGMKTIMETYEPISEVGEENATRVKITKGQIKPETYFNDKKHEIVKYQSNFFNRLKDSEELEPKAEFEVELYVAGIIPEMAQDSEGSMSETGRVLVKGWMPTYNGIEPLVLVAPEEDGVAEAIMSSYAVGDTVEFYGECCNRRIVHTEFIPVKIGKPRKKETTKYVNELVITGASETYEEAEDGVQTPRSAFSKEAIEAALSDRELVLAEKEKKAKGGKTENSFNKNVPSSGRKLPTF